MPIPQIKPGGSRESARAQVYRQLQDWIVDGTMQPGERISDQDVAEYFSVSRTPVREALQLLSEQGFVRVEPSRGTHVSPLNGDLAYSIYEALSSLSGCAAKLACQKQKKGDIARLRELNGDFERAVAAGEHDRLSNLDNVFHKFILKMADNPYISDAVLNLTMHSNRYENLYFREGTDRMESVREHEALIRALEVRDDEESTRAAEENWLGFYRRRLQKML